MYILVVVIHLLICFLLVGAVLLQAGKGAEVGAAFGGSSQTLFGSRGAAPFLSKLTIGAGAVYMITSLVLSVITKERSVISMLPSTTETQTKPASATTSTMGSTTPAAKKAEGVAPTSTPAAVVPKATSTQK
ncbi:MAG: preprotein translocase subunit SecG [Nitrospirota bacterium]